MLFGCSLTAALSVWQLGRAEAKRALIEAVLDGSISPAEALPDTGRAPPAEAARAVFATGTWVPAPQLLVDRHVEPGGRWVGVLSALRRPSGELLIVHRGHAAESRIAEALLLDTREPVRVEGLWRELPRAGLALGNPDCAPKQAVLNMNHPTPADLQCAFPGERIVDGVLMLKAGQPDALQVRWQVPGLTPERHLGYAFQWAALCAAIALTFYLVNRRKPRHD